MGKYSVNSYGKIYSDLAGRLWKITEHYDSLEIDNHLKYESTLYICILQNLLTQFNEIKNWKEGRGKETFDVKNIWENVLPFGGIKSKNVVLPKDDNLKIGFVLDKLRHILSHPFPYSSGLEYTSESIEGIISSYTFIETNTQTGEQVFLVILTPEELRGLLFELSSYLSKIAIH